MMTLISRSDAERKLIEHWTPAIKKARAVNLAVYIPAFERLRNYEFESLLVATFGGEFVINELCPFNGAYCRFGDVKSDV